VAGADIAAMSSMTQAEAEAFSRKGQAVFDAIEAMPVPVVAAVNGFALGGGCELVLSCDIVYAAENAIFGQPEVTLGIIPGFGGTARLVRVIGRNSALEWILAGQIISAQEAWRLGLVQKVLSASELLPAAIALARILASRGPIAVRAARRLVRAAQDVPLGAALDSEVKAFADLFDSDDRKEGMAAFLERRTPDFKGR
jgi:enoyl-CoA hydratase